MKGDEKEAVMRRFLAGQLQILVSTTVVEVGVDVANATLMVVEQAERLEAVLHLVHGPRRYLRYVACARGGRLACGP